MTPSFPEKPRPWLRRNGWRLLTAYLALLVTLHILGLSPSLDLTARLQVWQPFAAAPAPKAMGLAVLAVMGLLAGATLISEDLTCIGTGLLIAQGRIDFLPGAFACFFGIFIGDVMLFFAGRWLGRPALKRAPLKWFIRPEAVEKSSQWFSRRGMAVIFTSRFVPGARLPTYFAAGLLDTSFWPFALYFLLAGLVWAPMLVELSNVLGAQVIASALIAQQNIFIKIVAAVLAVYLVTKFITRLLSHKGRRLLLASWRRMTRWEFWPAYVFYIPVVCYVGLLALKHRSLTLFTAANPAIPQSGFVGESKADILKGLSKAGDYVARAALIDAAPSIDERIERATNFMADHQLDFPIVLKPNAGQRGSGVAVVRSTAERDDYLSRSAVDTIIQEYVPGAEFGVFYYRRPQESQGRIFSITEKRMPIVVGDGQHTIETLILNDDRARCMAHFYSQKLGERLWAVPANGERVQLVELGTHCRGAIFVDGGWVKTEKLEAVFDQISGGFDGFYFGRFDVRTPDVDEFKRGENFKIIELNGVTSEATHIYDPKNSLLTAYQVLFTQWRLAFEIGATNRERGTRPASIRTLIHLAAEYRQRARFHLS